MLTPWLNTWQFLVTLTQGGCRLLLTFNLVTDYDTFVNLDFNTSTASTTVLLKKSLSAPRPQCCRRVRRGAVLRLAGGAGKQVVPAELPVHAFQEAQLVAHELLRTKEKTTCM